MGPIVAWFEALFSGIPAPLLEVWGRLSYVVGAALAFCAFGGFTFRLGKRWGFGRERQSWDSEAVLSMPLTFLLVTLSGYLGSFIVLVPGAQTFESLKDLAVFLCIVCFGYPALLTVPVAYGVSDLVEGVPPEFLLAWLPGYFINPACFWLAYQLFGKAPDFRRARTWGLYAIFVALFMATEPILWGYVCAEKFTPEISYHAITPALCFTTLVTWLLAPFAMLVVLPLTRRLGLFWADIPGHVRERPLGGSFVWEAGATPGSVGVASERGLPIRLFILGPFIGLVLLLVGVTAYVTLRSAEEDATKLASRLHEEISENINLRLDDYLAAARARQTVSAELGADLDRLLASLPIARQGRAFIVDGGGRLVAASAARDAAVSAALAELGTRPARAPRPRPGFEYRFDLVTAHPLARETWLALAVPYADRAGEHADWIVTTALPEAYYLAGIRTGNSRSALVFAVALLLALGIAAALASNVTGALRRTSRATRALALGDLDARAPPSHLRELDSLASSFNEMADKLTRSFAELRKEVEARKLTERELRESEARVKRNEFELEELVRERTLALERARDEADRANRAKSNFLAHVSHEIRTPMNAILGFGQLIERDPELSAENRGRLRKILASGYHLLELINNVLALSKIEAGRAELVVTAFDLHAVVLEVEAMVRPAIADKGVNFRIEGEGTLTRYVRGDAGKLRQILLNLLGNAAKFTHAGSVVLQASVAPDGSFTRFEVIDTGVGIARGELTRVFEPFAQAASGKMASAGTGLGAAISRDFVQLMGGELEVTSELGRGTTFTLTLPLAPATAAEAQPVAPRGAVLGLGEGRARLKLLVVDDEGDNRAILRELLARPGIEIAEAEDGAGALARFTSFRPDLILMDVKMPGMDGVEATRRIRATAEGTSVPVVMLSASVFQEDREQVLTGGGNEFVAKPFREADLWDAIERQLGLALLRAPLAPESRRGPGAPSRADVQRLEPETLRALRSAVELGYVSRVPAIVASVGPEHRRTAAELSRLAAELELETLARLLAEETAAVVASDA